MTRIESSRPVPSPAPLDQTRLPDAHGESSFSKAQMAGLLALSIALTTLVFGRTITSSFLADDFNIVEAIRARGAFAKWSTSGEPFFRPLTSLLFFLDLEVWGLDPKGFHLTNLLLHALCSVLVIDFGARIATAVTDLEPQSRREFSLVAGLLFLLHPSHMEPIAWISGRGDLLVTLFALVCLSCYLRWRATGSIKWRVASLLALLLALGSKEAALAIPLILLPFEALSNQASAGVGEWRQRIGLAFRRTWPYLATLPCYLVLRWALLGAFVGGRGPQVHLNANPALLLDHLFHHFSRALVPRLWGVQLPAGAAALLGGALAGWLLLHWKEKNRAKLPLLMAMSVLCFAMAELPVLNLVVNRLTTRGERLIYLPSVFAALFASGLIFLLWNQRRRQIRRRVVAVVAILFALQCLLGAGPWREAAIACNTIRDALLARPAEDDVYIVGIPDAIQGAYAYQGGLNAALALAGESRIRPVVVNFVSLPELRWKISVLRSGQQLTIFTKQRHRRLRLRARRFPSRKLRMVFNERYRQEFELPRLSKGDRIFVFSEGQVGEVLPASPEAETAAGL